jgi:hypothetical protein
MQMIDTSVVRVHQHGASIAGNAEQHMGRSRGGLTSKIHAVVDANGLPVHLGLTPGEAHDNRLCQRRLWWDRYQLGRPNLPLAQCTRDRCECKYVPIGSDQLRRLDATEKSSSKLPH